MDGHLREQRLGFLVIDARVHDHVLALVPVDGRRHPVLVAELESYGEHLDTNRPVDLDLTVNHTVSSQRGVEREKHDANRRTSSKFLPVEAG